MLPSSDLFTVDCFPLQAIKSFTIQASKYKIIYGPKKVLLRRPHGPVIRDKLMKKEIDEMEG